ncbi:MAG: hypothetical protein ACOYU3_06430 [Bacillota bacterium]
MSDPDAVGLCMDELISALPRLEDGWPLLNSQLEERFSITDTPLFEYEEFLESYAQFRDWLTSILEETPVPKNVEGVVFSVFESEDGLELYLAGASGADEHANGEHLRPDTIEMFPDVSFAALDIYRDISSLHEEYPEAARYLALALPVVYLAEFISESSDNIEMLLRKKGILVRHREELQLSTGFDEEPPYPFATLTQAGLSSIAQLRN